MSCVLASVCMVFLVFESVCIFVETFVKGVIVSGLLGLKIMSSISCCVFMLVCFDV